MQNFTTSNFRPAGLIFMVELTARNPNTWVLCGEAAPSREWLNIGWDEVKSCSIKQGSSALMPLTILISSPTLGTKSVTITIW